jgi:hypothetical protein
MYNNHTFLLDHCVRLYVFICIGPSSLAYIYTHTHICIYIHTHICICIYTHVYMCIYIHNVYMYIYIYVYTHTHTHTYIYIYIYSPRKGLGFQHFQHSIQPVISLPSPSCHVSSARCRWPLPCLGWRPSSLPALFSSLPLFLVVG